MNGCIRGCICLNMNERNYIKIGVAGPVGSGKTALIERLTRRLAQTYSLAVITNDIYTKEDAEFLTQHSLLPPERIIGVETGGCPHTAIREDARMNLQRVGEMAGRVGDLRIIFIESGGGAPPRPLNAEHGHLVTVLSR